jgi:hypothetical protein
LQNITRGIGRARGLFRGNLRKGVKTAPPRPRKARKYGSLALRWAGWKLKEWGRVLIMGSTRGHLKPRAVEGKVRTARLTGTPGRFPDIPREGAETQVRRGRFG